MGKSYDVWSNTEHRVIGRIYEDDSAERAAERASERFRELKLKELNSELEKIEKDKRAKYIKSKLTDEELSEYEKRVANIWGQIKLIKVKIKETDEKNKTKCNRFYKICSFLLAIPWIIGILSILLALLRHTISPSLSLVLEFVIGIPLAIFIVTSVASWLTDKYSDLLDIKIQKFKKEILEKESYISDLIFEYES